MSDPTNIRDVRHIRTLSSSAVQTETSVDRDVNQALALGWELLSVVPTERGPKFVLGWSKEGAAPQTEIEKEQKDLYRSWGATDF